MNSKNFSKMQESSKAGESSDNVNQNWWRNEHFKSQNPRILNRSGSNRQLNTAREVENRKIIQVQESSEKACRSSQRADEVAIQVNDQSNDAFGKPESAKEPDAQRVRSDEAGKNGVNDIEASPKSASSGPTNEELDLK